jgi:hypothetical protein
MRDISDCLTKVRADGESKGTGGSPFNVREKSLTLADFTREEIGGLYRQHTAETGQVFDPEAVERAWHWTEGQPWLVNALAKDIIEERYRSDYSRTVTGPDVDVAARDIILRDDTHFRSLRERLREPRVRRVMDAVLVGTSSLTIGISNDDALYAVDLGLLKPDPVDGKPQRPANPIYKEIIVRTLNEGIQTEIPPNLADKLVDGLRLDMNGILKAFQDYWRKNRKSLAEHNELESRVEESVKEALARFNIADGGMGKPIARAVRKSQTDRADEAFCLLVLLAFMQMVVNGLAKIKGDYVLGMTRVEIFVKYNGIAYPLELKIKATGAAEIASRSCADIWKKAVRQQAGWSSSTGT